MKIQQKQQSETPADHASDGNAGKRLPIEVELFGIIATVFAIIYFIMSVDGSSRASTQPEREAQEKFQEKWNTAQLNAEQKWDSVLKAAEQNQGDCPDGN